MNTRAVIALGIGQCVNWGVLYYAFAILVVPIERELAIPTWVVTGAFSLALLVSAIAAPAIGRWADRGRGAWLIQGGGIAAAALLVAWAFTPGVLAMYVAWAALGLCMSAALYEPAFIVIGRAHDDPAARLRALALVTLFGGLASTIFLPVTAILVDTIGWRGGVFTLAGLLLVSAGLTRMFVFRRMPASSPGVAAARSASPAFVDARDTSRFHFVAASFALGTFASAGFAANLVPALGESGASPATAAMLGGVMGVMQLPGRALLMNGTFAGSPGRLLAASLLLHAVGLGAVAVAVSPLAIAAGTMTLALGAGASTLVRPHLIHTTFSADCAGYLNGRLARAQQLARAAGPLALAWLAGGVTYGAVFAVLALVFAGLALASAGVLGDVWKSTLANRSSS